MNSPLHVHGNYLVPRFSGHEMVTKSRSLVTRDRDAKEAVSRADKVQGALGGVAEWLRQGTANPCTAVFPAALVLVGDFYRKATCNVYSTSW